MASEGRVGQSAEKALREAVEEHTRALLAFDYTEDEVPAGVDVPDAYERGLHDAATGYMQILQESRRPPGQGPLMTAPTRLSDERLRELRETAENGGVAGSHIPALRALWRGLAERDIEHGADWPYIARTLFSDLDEARGTGVALLAEVETLRGKVAAVEALAERWRDHRCGVCGPGLRRALVDVAEIERPGIVQNPGGEIMGVDHNYAVGGPQDTPLGDASALTQEPTS